MTQEEALKEYRKQFDPIPKFRRIAKGFCPDCDGKLSESGYCPDCRIRPGLDPDFQNWMKNLGGSKK